jgi:uncharacterized protein YfdQ (DUF2303 family)
MAENNGSALDVGAVREVARLAQKAIAVVEKETVHYAVVPNDCNVKSLAEFQYPHGVPPERIRAQVKLSDAASFAEYVKKFWNPHATVVFAQPERFSFLAVVDYHQSADEANEEYPSFCDHKATFQMAQDERWKIWIGQDNKPMAQADFAEFVEDNMADIFQPPAADMLEIARDLKAKIDVNFGSSVRSQSGQVQLKYEETVKAGVGPAGIIEVPEDFSIQIPVFYGEQPVVIKARLRFRINQGKLSFHYKLNRPNEVQMKAFETAVLGLQQTLGANILLGSPS